LVPGFPVPRAGIERTAAGNKPLALVTAGAPCADPEDISEQAFAAELDSLNAYVELLCSGR
jgi:hypothetical protein